ncbi:scavenger receptor class B member 1-like [Rhynchophorus ferrugineus]|uniref:scavenger receptor class B member 1-like n=1 Tax=Rhynchophorus ferrugineus TaxID=354439 RepID=UPI003FCE56D4
MDMSDNRVNSSVGYVYDSRSHSNLSSLEKNCNQIFLKGPALTRDFFDKIQNDVVPPKTEFFGYTMSTRRFFLLTALFLLFTFSCMGTITMWFTNVYKKQINSMLVISEESETYEMWRAPTVKSYLKIYIFNYTNVERFELRKDKKLQVKELGPYVYQETIEKVNVKFNKVDGTVSFQEKRVYTFRPELSKGSKYDSVMVPNIPMLTSASFARLYNFFLRVSFSTILTSISAKPFIKLTVDEFINGYEDNLYDLGKNYLKFNDMRVFEHFGLLALKAGLQPDIVTLNTGLHNINKLGQVEKYNGEREFTFWNTDSCNKIRSSDGVMYPISDVNKKADLEFFMPHMCRKIPLNYNNSVTILDNIPVHRYKFPANVFDSGYENDHFCYCTNDDGSCPPHGIFNATPCAFGSPLFYSWPHFAESDPDLLEAVSGLRNNFSVDSFIDVHPKLGLLVGGKIQFQVNVQLQKSYGILQLNPYPNNLMIPTVWIEGVLDSNDIPQDLLTIIYAMTFTVRNVELGLKYGTLLTTMVTLTCIFLVLKKRRDIRSHPHSFGRDIEFDQ